MARTISPPRTSRRSPPVQRHPSSTTPTTSSGTNTTTTSNPTNRSLVLQRVAERSNVPIAPATSSNTSSPIYSTTSSPPPISPGIPQYPAASSLGTMAPSRSDSRSAALAIDMAPTSTPTGRISKAKKGKRVHACEFPGCGKIFTRAEHRRRHELNHNPDATYRCAQSGCGKSFHRLDLLQRHQERHELEASTQPASPGNRRYPTHTAVLSEAPSALPTTTMASPQMPQPQPRAQSSGIPIPALINNNVHPYGPDYGMNAAYLQLFNSTNHWENPIYVPEPVHSPMPRGAAPHRPAISSASSVVSYDHNANGSPMLPTTIPNGNWSQAPPPDVLPANMFETDMPPYHSSIPQQYPSPIWTDTSGTTLDENYQLYQDCYPVLTEPMYPIL